MRGDGSLSHTLWLAGLALIPCRGGPQLLPPPAAVDPDTRAGSPPVVGELVSDVAASSSPSMGELLSDVAASSSPASGASSSPDAGA